MGKKKCFLIRGKRACRQITQMGGMGSGDTRREIVGMAGRTLFVTAYADAIDEDRIKGPRAGAGDDWMDVSPKTPRAFQAAGKRLIEEIEKTNGIDISAAYDRAARNPGRHHKDPSPEDFGYCLAMEALGHGVGWSDDHPDHGLHIPRVESYIFGRNNYEITI